MTANPLWDVAARDAAYTALCNAISAASAEAGPAGETLYLARLALLLAERLADPAAVQAAIADARLPAGGA
ncbi:hypothetical protein [Parapedomonas caeni]